MVNISCGASIAEILRSNKRTLSAEIIPPRNGSESQAVITQIAALKDVPVDFISVTKGAGGSLRGGTLPIAQIIAGQFAVSSLAHFTCRDYSIEEIENNLMDHHYLGVHNILALRGDAPEGQPDFFKPKDNRHSYAYQLVEQIKKLNSGKYLIRDGFDIKKVDQKNFRDGQPLNFCIGVAAHPEHEPESERFEYFMRKVRAGAEFAITQMIFSAQPYERFIEALAKKGVNIPILPGVRVVTQESVAQRMIKKFGCKIPKEFLTALSRASNPEEGKKIGLDHTRRFCEKMLDAGAPGIHAFVMNDAITGATLLKGFKN